MTQFREEEVHPETFREIQDDATLAVTMIFPLLFVIYSVTIGPLALFLLMFFFGSVGFVASWSGFFTAGVLLGFFLAAVHALIAYCKPITGLIRRLGAEQPDAEDHYHKTLRNVVDEITIAAGIDNVHVGVIPTPKTNALAVGTRDRAAVLVTEGALGRLRRDELQAVVAHETAHVVYGDSRIKFFTANIVSFFESIYPLRYFEMRSQGGCLFFWITSIYGLGLTIVSFVMRSINRILSMTISHEREWRADATAVEYTRDPVALASALHKIGVEEAEDAPIGEDVYEKYRETLAYPAYRPLLFVPFESGKSESSDRNVSEKGNGRATGLKHVVELFWPDNTNNIGSYFSSHPPVQGRIERVLKLANVPYEELENRLESEEGSPRFPVRALRDEQGIPLLEQDWLLRENGGSQPMEMVDLLMGGVLSDDVLVSRDGEEEWSSPGDHPELKKLKKIYSTEGGHGQCPNCGARLRRRFYLGVPLEACVLCGGVALSWKDIIRLESRYREDVCPDELQEIEDYQGYHGGEEIPEEQPVEGVCSNCETTLRAKRYRDTKLVVDRCPSCYTTWFEEDELTIGLNLSEPALFDF